MNKQIIKDIFLSFILILLFGCEDKPNPTVITVGKTHKISSKNNWVSNYDISYFWAKPQGPDNHKSSWVINDESVLFTPRIPGEYNFSLSVETTTGKILGSETFHFLAINNNEVDKNIIKKSTIKDTIISSENVNKDYSEGFSVQVSSWNQENQAIKHQQKLVELGFDNIYIIKKIYNEKKVKWRVRLGPYENMDNALETKKNLESKGYNSFISNVKYKN